MRKRLNRKLFLSLVLTLLIVFPPSYILAGTDAPVHPANSANQLYPAISGDIVVWMDFRNGSGIPEDPGYWWNVDIYMYDLANGVERRVTSEPTNSNQVYPDVSGRKIVWEDWRNNDIYLRTVNPDGTLGAETQITNHPASQARPAISGNKIVWHDNRNWNFDIYLYDLDNPVPNGIQINTTDPRDQVNPAISGDYIVWVDERDGNEEIYLYDLSVDSNGNGIPNYLESPRPSPDPAEVRITNNPSRQVSPDIYQNHIVWVDGRNFSTADYDIYRYDLSTGTEIRVTTNSAVQFNPNVHSHTIAWVDKRTFATKDFDIYKYDPSTGVEEKATSYDSSKQVSPDVYGNRLVWEDWRNGHADIYINYLSDTTQPYVKSTNPANNETGVSTNTKVKASFSEAMRDSTTTSLAPDTITTDTFYLKDGSDKIVPASVSYDLATDTAILTPSSPLPNNATYTATVTTGVKDLAGNNMASVKEWGFTVGDIQAPAQVIDLAMASRTSSSIKLTWTAPGDDGTTGTASQYDIRYSTSDITTEADWDAATKATGEPVPQTAGSTERFTVSDLNPETTYYFALKTADEVPNWSVLSNVVSVKTLIVGDINGDGRVSLIDLTILADAYGSRQGDANYNPAADLNADGRVSLIDLTLLADNYGRSL